MKVGEFEGSGSSCGSRTENGLLIFQVRICHAGGGRKKSQKCRSCCGPRIKNASRLSKVAAGCRCADLKVRPPGRTAAVLSWLCCRGRASTRAARASCPPRSRARGLPDHLDRPAGERSVRSGRLTPLWAPGHSAGRQCQASFNIAFACAVRRRRKADQIIARPARRTRETV